MTAPSIEECLVCGAETKNRCSSCAKAGIDLFFCSPEHQKLVWHVHRLFCGPGKANPWRWPLLSPAEVEAAIATLDTVSLTHSESKTLADQLLRFFRVPRERLPDVIRSLSRHPTGLPLHYETTALRGVRMHAHFVRSTSLKRDGVLNPSPVVEILTSISLSSFLYLYEDNPPPWVTGYLHRCSIYVPLITSAPRDNWIQSLNGAVDRVLQYLERVAQTDPERAHKVEGGFRRFLQKMEQQFAPGSEFWSMVKGL